MLSNEEKWFPGIAGASLITLTDPSLMCSVPLQLEKILDVVHQPLVWGDRRMDDTPLPEEKKMQGW